MQYKKQYKGSKFQCPRCGNEHTGVTEGGTIPIYEKMGWKQLLTKRRRICYKCHCKMITEERVISYDYFDDGKRIKVELTLMNKKVLDNAIACWYNKHQSYPKVIWCSWKAWLLLGTSDGIHKYSGRSIPVQFNKDLGGFDFYLEG